MQAFRSDRFNHQESGREGVVEAVMAQRRVVVLPYHQNRRRIRPRRQCGFTTAAQLLRDEQAGLELSDLELERCLVSKFNFHLASR